MKILFIDTPGSNPPAPGVRRGNISHAAGRLSAQLIGLGHTVSLLDMMNHYENRELSAIDKAVKTFGPDMVCFTILSVQYKVAMEAIKRVRQLSDCPIVAGGTGVVCSVGKIFQDCGFALDVAVLGEGEMVLPRIVNSYENNLPRQLTEIKGLLVNQNGTVKDTGLPEMIPDLDVFPFENLEIFGIKSLGIYDVMGSRGCVFNCSFCFNHAGHRMRNRKPEKIVEELLAARRKYKFTRFRFVDAFLNNDKQWLMDVCHRIKASELSGIKWDAQGIRADHLDEELCRTMVSAGCETVGIGVESLHPEVYKKVRKGTPIKTLEAGVRLAVKYFPKVVSYMIIGLESDTLKKALYSYRRIKSLKTTHLLYCMALPFPGTRLEKYVNDHGRRIRATEDSMLIYAGDDAKISFDTPEFPLEDRQKAFKIIMVKEFLYIAWTSLRAPKDLSKWLKLALRYDTLKFPVHLFKVWQQDRKLRRLVRKPQTFVDFIDYRIIPDGTRGIKGERTNPAGTVSHQM